MLPGELKALQSPLKDRYRENPATALATLQAQGRVRMETITVELVNPPPASQPMGLHPGAGGDGQATCAAERLLEALVGCAGVTFAAVCTSMELDARDVLLTASGDLDFRGTLGVSREVPVGFTNVRLHFEFASSAADDKLTKAVQLAERYCVVAQTLQSVTASWSRHGSVV